MAKTTYQEIWDTFVDFTGVPVEDLPQTEEGMYSLIKSGILKYNSVTEKSETKLIGNEIMEELNVELDYDRLLLLAYCLKYIFLENEKNEYESVWGVFSNDIGLKFYGDTVKAKRSTLSATNKEIFRLLNKIDPMSFLE
jgi:hypothetical protein|nr:MAG TPA: hypothetical protein [Caudoviricetes sp.]